MASTPIGGPPSGFGPGQVTVHHNDATSAAAAAGAPAEAKKSGGLGKLGGKLFGAMSSANKKEVAISLPAAGHKARAGSVDKPDSNKLAETHVGPATLKTHQQTIEEKTAKFLDEGQSKLDKTMRQIASIKVDIRQTQDVIRRAEDTAIENAAYFAKIGKPPPKETFSPRDRYSKGIARQQVEVTSMYNDARKTISHTNASDVNLIDSQLKNAKVELTEAQKLATAKGAGGASAKHLSEEQVSEMVSKAQDKVEILEHLKASAKSGESHENSLVRRLEIAEAFLAHLESSPKNVGDDTTVYLQMEINEIKEEIEVGKDPAKLVIKQQIAEKQAMIDNMASMKVDANSMAGRMLQKLNDEVSALKKQL